MHVLRPIWLALAGALGALGLTGAIIAAPLPTVLFLAGTAALCHFIYALIGRPGRCPRSPEQRATAAALSALAVFLVAGLSAVLGPSTVPVLMLLAATSPPATRWYVQRVPHRPEPVQRTVPAHDDRHSTDATALTSQSASTNATGLTDEELCLAWRSSFTTLNRATAAAELAQIAAARRDYLDELERRYPTAFSRWISAGARAASNPAKYLDASKRTQHHNPQI